MLHFSWNLMFKLDSHGLKQYRVCRYVIMKISVFWDIVLCNPLKIYWRFRGTCLLHLQGFRISWARNQQNWWQAGFQQTIRPYVSDNRTLHRHHCENLKSYRFWISFFFIIFYTFWNFYHCVGLLCFILWYAYCCVSYDKCILRVSLPTMFWNTIKQSRHYCVDIRFYWWLVATLHVLTLYLGHLLVYKNISISFWIAWLINMSSYCVYRSQVYLLN
jgi:hypothetical protein